jgi:hypothetical protein
MKGKLVFVSCALAAAATLAAVARPVPRPAMNDVTSFTVKSVDRWGNEGR